MKVWYSELYICVIWKLIFCILSLLKEISNRCELDHGPFTPIIKLKPSFQCNLDRPVQHVIILLKQLVLAVTEYTCTWVYYKTTCSSEGSSKPRAPEPGFENEHYFNCAEAEKIDINFIHLFISFVNFLLLNFLFHSYLICHYIFC